MASDKQISADTSFFYDGSECLYSARHYLNYVADNIKGISNSLDGRVREEAASCLYSIADRLRELASMCKEAEGVCLNGSQSFFKLDNLVQEGVRLIDSNLSVYTSLPPWWKGRLKRNAGTPKFDEVNDIMMEDIDVSEKVTVIQTVPSIGDVVQIDEGQVYTSTSQGGAFGVVGETVRQSGDYTVDAIAVLDKNGNILASFSDNSTNVQAELDKLGLTNEDINNGNVEIKYNVSEGVNPDLDRTNAAGWISYDSEGYTKSQNVFNQESTSNVNAETPSPLSKEEAAVTINKMNSTAQNSIVTEPEFVEAMKGTNVGEKMTATPH